MGKTPMNARTSFFQYVIPSMLAFALSGVYAIADGFFVGNALGDNALAAINVAYPLTAFLQAAGTGIGMGSAIEYSIQIGKGNKEEARQYYGMSLILLFVTSVLLTALYLAGASFLLGLFGATEEIFTLGSEYLLYISFGAVFQILGTGLVPLIRNMGGAIVAMAAMITGFLTNIFLDYLFVWIFPWGMMGAAVATAIGQAMTFLVCVGFFIAKRQVPSLPCGKKILALSRRILSVGLSPFGLTFSPNITLILINKSAAIVGGNLAVTCYAPISYICSIIILLMQGVSDGSQPLISLTYGEGKLGLTRTYRNMAYRFSLVVAAVCMAVLFFLRGYTAILFGASPEISRQVAQILPIFLGGFLFISISRVSTAYFYATRKNLWAYILIYGEPASLFLLLLFVPSAAGGILGTWISIPLSQAIAALISVYLILRDRDQKAPVK